MTEQKLNSQQSARSKPWSHQVAVALLKRNSARIGLLWIAILVFIATFSPFLASSHPLYMVVDGQASSPLLIHMSAQDWVWLAAFVFMVLLVKWSRPLWQKLLLWAGLVAVSALVANAVASPPT
ncbi:MAG TPA: ABC transporter permease, partial [Methylophaga sp.]|nr:ABC transporter permease [Methylophaga sp.]